MTDQDNSSAQTSYEGISFINVANHLSSLQNLDKESRKKFSQVSIKTGGATVDHRFHSTFHCLGQSMKGTKNKFILVEH